MGSAVAVMRSLVVHMTMISFRHVRFFATLALLVAPLCVSWAPVLAQPAGDGVSAIQQPQPDFFVHVEVNRESRDYREGDTFAIKVASAIDSYIYVIYEQADGQAFQVFPNSVQPDNRVRARQAVQIPNEDDLFRWRIAPPFGAERIKVLATEEPLHSLSDPSFRSKRFNSLSNATVKGIGLELGPPINGGDPINQPDLPRIPPDSKMRWSETEIEVTTYPRNQQLVASGARRYGVFFGVSDHKYSVLREIITGRSLNLSSPHRDARDLAGLLGEIGDLNEVKVFTNEEATRANLESAVTEWLPKRSRPGDTVFIYFSGHGGTIPDDGTDEIDGEDEYLVPCDQFGWAELLGSLKLSNEGSLPPQFQPMLEFARRIVRQFTTPELASNKLDRATGVTDDLFGHWLQSLDGRQVVVILDICHSGGFATAEKGIESKRFDFLDQELGQLKDIGQGNTVLLTASGSDELSLVRPDGELSVMTYHLLNILKSSRGPVDIDQAFVSLEKEMEEFFQSEEFRRMNAGRDEKSKYHPHHPVLYKYTGERVWIKP